MKSIAISLFGLALFACTNVHSGVAGEGAPPSSNQPASPNQTKGKLQFQPYEVIDQQQGGLAVARIAVPQGWKTTSKVVWDYNNFYVPNRVSVRSEAPDGSSWIEFFPGELFVWLDAAHEHPGAHANSWGIDHPNITLKEAMIRYVIARNRRNVNNLRILGYRPVNDLPKAFPHVGLAPTTKGEGICMRASYDVKGSPVDEEFYGFMTPVERLSSPNGRIFEFHRQFLLIHSMGAKSGKLESVRPLLGFMATSIEPNPAWQKRYAEVKKMQGDIYKRVMAQNYAGIKAAGEQSARLTAQSNQFLKQMDAEIAARNSSMRSSSSSSSYGSGSNDDFYKRADDFDQNIRGTEHLVDQNGQVSDQYTDYNYHWTDGFGTYVHTNDPNFDPNRYLSGSFEQMTPAPR